MNVAKISSARCSHSQPTKGAVASDGKPSTTALMRNACSSSYVAVGVTRLDDCVGGANLNRALVRNVRTYTAMPREKAQVATTTRPKVPMRRLGADCLVVVMKRGNARGAKGAGHRHWRGSTGNGRNSNGRRQPSCDGTSRISCKIWYSISQTMSDRDRSIHAFAVKPRAFGAPLSGFGA